MIQDGSIKGEYGLEFIREINLPETTEGIYRGKLVPVGEYIVFIDAPILGGKAGYVLIVKH